MHLITNIERNMANVPSRSNDGAQRISDNSKQSSELKSETNNKNDLVSSISTMRSESPGIFITDVVDIAQTEQTLESIGTEITPKVSRDKSSAAHSSNADVDRKTTFPVTQALSKASILTAHAATDGYLASRRFYGKIKILILYNKF